MRTVELTCTVCQKTFERNKNEHARSQRLGRRVFCSRHCCGVSNGEHLPEAKPENAAHLTPDNRRDHLSPFRWHLKNVRSHCKGRRVEREVTIELSDLKEQWDIQGGICPYTGWVLKNMVTSSPSHRLVITPDRASLDRKDSTKGYIKGNIQFVSLMAQYAKNAFTEEQLIGFCRRVAEHAQLV